MRLPGWARDARARWHYTGSQKPPLYRPPGPGQRSVWDFPRPPRIEASPADVCVRAGDLEIARSRRCLRVLETGSPPSWYIPIADVGGGRLAAAEGASRCEWKGEARYWDLELDGERLHRVAWSYPEPFPEFTALRDHVSFYPGRVECLVDGLRVRPQPGGFYGGWVTPELVGPFKGEPGTEGL